MPPLNPTSTHRAARGIGRRIAAHVGSVPIGMAGRQQGVERLALQLHRRAAEDAFGRGVEHQHQALLIHTHHGIAGRVEDGGKGFTLFAQRQGGGMPVADVGDCTQHVVTAIQFDALYRQLCMHHTAAALLQCQVREGGMALCCQPSGELLALLPPRPDAQLDAAETDQLGHRPVDDAGKFHVGLTHQAIVEAAQADAHGGGLEHRAELELAFAQGLLGGDDLADVADQVEPAAVGHGHEARLEQAGASAHRGQAVLDAFGQTGLARPCQRGLPLCQQAGGLNFGNQPAAELAPGHRQGGMLRVADLEVSPLGIHQEPQVGHRGQHGLGRHGIQLQRWHGRFIGRLRSRQAVGVKFTHGVRTPGQPGQGWKRRSAKLSASSG